MKTKQSNFLNMATTTRDLMNSSTTITNAVPQVAPIVTSLSGYLTQANGLIEIQVVNNKGFAINKNLLKTILRTTAHEISCKIAAYAQSVNNTVLYNEVHITEARFKYASDFELKELGQLIYDRANANATALAAFGVTAIAITGLLSALNNFSTALPKLRISVSEKKTATVQIEQIIVLINETLKKLDVLVDTFRYSQTTFWSNYHNSRKIVDLGQRSLALKAKVIDALTKNAIKGAELTFKNADAKGNGAITRVTAAKGGLMMKTLATGKYKLTLVASGYETKEMEIYINDTEMYKLEVELNKFAS